MTQCSRYALGFVFSACLALNACSGLKKEAVYPTRPEASGSDDIVYTDQKRSTIFGEGETIGAKLFSGEEEDTGSSGIGVNSFLWRAALDTVSFMPIASADPFGGVILTDWYENPDTPGERFKVNTYILDRQLRADGIRVSVFKQTLNGGKWRDAKVSDKLALDLENTILTRAREFRVQQTSAK